MADPKYATLPGIAVDQPDVYETSELAEADQHLDYDNDEVSDAVETLHISSNEAFAKFKGKQLDTENVDFSDKIRRSKQKGYIAWTGDFELAGEGENETPEQKYQRLNCDVRQLMDELENLKESGAEKVGNQSLIGLAKQTALLQDQLAGLKLEEYLGSAPVKDLQDPSGTTKRKLLTQIEQMKASKVDSATNKTSSSGDNQVMYELMMKPDTSKMEETQKLALFESRLEGLEKVLGPSQQKLSVLSVETNTKNVTAAISVLNSRLALLEPSHLEHVEGRLAALLQKLNSLSEKKVALEDSEKNNKVAELYDMVTANQAVASALPDVVDRLDSLQALHDQALQFSKTLVQLDSLQQKLESNLSTNQKTLEETKTKFSENLGTIQKNFDTIDQRLTKLKK